MGASWGLLGPAVAVGERRTRTLGLGAAVRRFNELAVPGIGGVWFAKQLMLSALGLQVAAMARDARQSVSNVECANAIEALACWLGFTHGKWQRDPRLRGHNKLPRQHDLAFKDLRRRSFYVTQPMRMATVLAMQPLGLATATSGRRFSAFSLTDEGRTFLEAACAGYLPANRQLVDHLVLWVCGRENRMNTQTLQSALSPALPLHGEARSVLRDRLVRGGAGEPATDTARRRNAITWMDTLKRHPAAVTWGQRPEAIDTPHWEDIKAGAYFFTVRDAAIELLDALECQLAIEPGERWRVGTSLPPRVSAPFDALQQAADAFLKLDHHDTEANDFCRQCTLDVPERVIAELAHRDGRVVRLVDDCLRPGPAFRRSPAPEQTTDDDEANDASLAPAVSAAPDWPANISPRVRNLYLLNLDLHSELGDHLGTETPGDGE